MSYKVTNIGRSFFIKRKGEDIPLEDPNPNMSPEDVMKFYSGKYPELTTSNVTGPKIVDNKSQYTFQTIIGEKG